MLENRNILSIVFADPTADKVIGLLRVPDKNSITVEDAYAVNDTALAASTANYVETSLENGGTSGTAATVISGTAGGTAGWAANVPQQMAPIAGSGKLTAGQWLNGRYAETGTVAPGRTTMVVEFVWGIGSKANA